MPGLDKSFFITNRERVYDELKGGVLVVSAYSRMQRSNDTSATFEQESNFWYLCGIEQPDWWLFMDAKRRRSWLVAPTVEKVHEIFDGSLNFNDAMNISGVEEILDRQMAESWLRQTARHHEIVYIVGNPPNAEKFGFILNPAPYDIQVKLGRIFTKVSDFRMELARIRAIKQPVEISMIQSAIDLTIKGFDNVRKKIGSYQYEYEIEADFTHYFRRAGSKGHAYDPIVASGFHACTLHYTDNSDCIKRGSLVLIDIGARMHGYAADITRTFAVSKPSVRHQNIHDAVRLAHEKIIDFIKPGLSLIEYQNFVDTTMKQALIELKMITDFNDEKYRTYFPHSISHGLGIDVHDALGNPKTLQPGMILTVEPGVYIRDEGVGIRIEDDILVTESGHKNLSEKLTTQI